MEPRQSATTRPPTLDGAPEWRIPPRRAETAFPTMEPRLYHERAPYDCPTQDAPRPRNPPTRKHLPATKSRYQDYKGSKRPLRPTEQRVLTALVGKGWATIHDLAGGLGLRPRTVRYELLSLSKRRLIVMERDASQRGPHGWAYRYRLA